MNLKLETTEKGYNLTLVISGMMGMSILRNGSWEQLRATLAPLMRDMDDIMQKVIHDGEIEFLGESL